MSFSTKRPLTLSKDVKNIIIFKIHFKVLAKLCATLVFPNKVVILFQW